MPVIRFVPIIAQLWVHRDALLDREKGGRRPPEIRDPDKLFPATPEESVYDPRPAQRFDCKQPCRRSGNPARNYCAGTPFFFFCLCARLQSRTSFHPPLFTTTRTGTHGCLLLQVVYGDKHSQSLFDYFCEKNMLALFIQLVKQASSDRLRETSGAAQLTIQVIQTLTILTQKIQNVNSFYYLMSNNHINALIAHPFDFAQGCGNEELLAYYVSFLKSLSLKLNAETIQFFFDERTGDFPLYSQAAKLFDCAEIMVRTSVRTVILNIYRIQARPAIVLL